VDGIVPPQLGRDYAAAAAAAGDRATAIVIPGADHFAQIDPGSEGWGAVRTRILAAIGSSLEH
jgi:pimeloyl-ACP methyl ester carboxylesterase